MLSVWRVGSASFSDSWWNYLWRCGIIYLFFVLTLFRVFDSFFLFCFFLDDCHILAISRRRFLKRWNLFEFVSVWDRQENVWSVWEKKTNNRSKVKRKRFVGMFETLVDSLVDSLEAFRVLFVGKCSRFPYRFFEVSECSLNSPTRVWIWGPRFLFKSFHLYISLDNSDEAILLDCMECLTLFSDICCKIRSHVQRVFGFWQCSRDSA